MPRSRTLPSRQRSHVLRAYRSRGRANRNIWLVYSLKTNRDWILASDRHLVHWLLFLETNPDVHSFVIDPTDGVPEGLTDGRSRAVDALAVLADGKREYHRLLFSTVDDDSQARPSGETLAASAELVRVFAEADLHPRGAEAMRWLKVIGYCAAIRDERQSEATLAAVTIMRGLGRGKVVDATDRMADFDSQIALGVISRMAVLGDITLDLSASGFTMASRWAWRRTR
jgi:hypothetical protein